MSRLFTFAFLLSDLGVRCGKMSFRDEVFGFGHAGAVQGVFIAFFSACVPL